MSLLSWGENISITVEEIDTYSARVDIHSGLKLQGGEPGLVYLPTFVAGLMIFAGAQSAIHEIEAFVLFLIGGVFFGGCSNRRCDSRIPQTDVAIATESRRTFARAALSRRTFTASAHAGRRTVAASTHTRRTDDEMIFRRPVSTSTRVISKSRNAA
jgi:hypothetical protein